MGAYVFLAANPYPWFRVQQDYPVDVEIDPPVRQGRWGGFFRLLLAVPALVLAGTRRRLGRRLVGSSSAASSNGGEEALWFNASSAGGVAAAAAFLAWFAILAHESAPRGLCDVTAFAWAMPHRPARISSCSPALPDVRPEARRALRGPPEHPLRIVVDDDLARPRLTVLFRLFLAIPHFVWILLWSIAVFFVGFVAWILALVLGRVPDPLHRFLAAYIRYATHLFAFVGLVGRRFPASRGAPARTASTSRSIRRRVRTGGRRSSASSSRSRRSSSRARSAASRS